MTATWPRNIPAKMNRPHSVVPQNFQTRGGRWSGIAGGTATALAGVRESIRWLSLVRPFSLRLAEMYSRQRTPQQAAYVVMGQIHRAVHAGVIPGKARGGEQLRMARRHGVERGRSRQQRQPFDREPRHTLAVRPPEYLADEGDDLPRARQSERFAGQFMHDAGRHF